MKKFEAPTIDVMKLDSEEVLTNSQCLVEALGCASCYCVAVDDDDPSIECPDCYNFF